MDFRSYVISWNLTRRCNLFCKHCYIDGAPGADTAEELSLAECRRVIDELATVSPGALIILTGGEPLARKDVFGIARHAADRGFMVVMGSNAALIDEGVVRRMRDAGVKGVGLSLDSLDPAIHNRFRAHTRAWEHTVSGMRTLKAFDFPFLVQTTVIRENYGEIPDLMTFAHREGAKVFNLYFLVPTGRGKHLSNISPQEYEDLLRSLRPLQARFAGEMLVNAKCAPHYQRILFEVDPQSAFLKPFAGGGGCPAGTQYCGITPTGNVTPCPYLPVYGGNLRTQSFQAIWEGSEVFTMIRQRNRLGGKCGPCEFSRMCGGCRARAYGALDDCMGEDPWCVYTPGAHGGAVIEPPQGDTYGVRIEYRLQWSAEARARMELAPAFVRGMVVKRVEEFAAGRGEAMVTAATLEAAKARFFGGRVAKVPSFLNPR